MPNLATFLLLLVAILVGAAVPLQAAANAMLSHVLGHPLWASLVSLGVSVVCVVLMMIVLKIPAPAMGQIAKGPWWIWAGGIVGFLYVTAALMIAPKLGAAGFTVAVIVGQIVISALIDQFGLMGFPQAPIKATRLIGIALIIGGMILVQMSASARPD